MLLVLNAKGGVHGQSHVWLTVAAGLATSIFAAVGTAKADLYKWCAFYSGGREGGGTNCGFVTLEQCRATISGVGGSCGPNQLYTGPAERRVRHARKRYRS